MFFVWFSELEWKHAKHLPVQYVASGEACSTGDFSLHNDGWKSELCLFLKTGDELDLQMLEGMKSSGKSKDPKNMMDILKGASDMGREVASLQQAR